MTTPDRDRYNKNVEIGLLHMSDKQTVKPDFVVAIDEAIEKHEKQKGQIRTMSEIESLQSRNHALMARVRQLESEQARLHSYADGLNAECNDLMFAIQGAMPWMILLGDYIGNGTKDDPMGRCNAILKMNNALGRNDEEAIESGRVDIR